MASRSSFGGRGDPHNRDSDDVPFFSRPEVKLAMYGLGAAAVGGAIWLVMSRYHVAAPTEYIVRTGLFIPEISIAKKAFRWPLQRAFVLDITPTSYSFTAGAMTSEKLAFHLPMSFTIGPRDDPEALQRYARFLMHSEGSGPVVAGKGVSSTTKLEQLVKGIIEGETRVLAASMTVDQIFGDRVALKERIVGGVDQELAKFGAVVWTANIKDLEDTPGSEFFSVVRRRAVEGASNQAKIDVAEARKRGDVGEKRFSAETRQSIADLEATTQIVENEKAAARAESSATLRVRQAGFEQNAKLAEISARQAALMREAELEVNLQQRNAQVEQEVLRTKKLASAIVEAEATIKRAEGEAEAARRTADAELYRKQKEAEALLALQQKEAEGTRAKYQALSEGLASVRTSMGGSPEALLQFLMVEREVYTELAAKNAEAVRGMNPKITIWTTGSEGGAGGVGGAAGGPGGVRALADIYKMLPPLATTVAEQTGIRPPSWMLDMSSVPVESSGSAVATAADGDAAAAPAGPAATAVVPVIPVPSSGAVSRAAAVPPPRPHANGAASASLSAPNPAAAARAAAAGISTILPGGKLV